MSETTRRLLLSAAVILLAACLCLSLVSIGAAAFLFIADRQVTILDTPIVETSVPPTTSPADTSLPELTITATIEAGEIPPDVLAQMRRIEQQVIQYRGLQPSGEVDRVLYTPEQLRDRIENDFFTDYTPEEAAQDEIVLWAFGLLARNTDLIDLYVDLYSENVIGFYDDETGEMVVVQGSGFKGPEHLTYAHEFTHALQDQNYDLDEGLGYTEEACQIDSERCAAIQALVEGDASYSELIWFSDYASPQEQTEILAEFQNYDDSSLDAFPPFMQQDLSFPYTYGFDFVGYLFDLGEWDAVNDAYLNPPVTTEQIMHPERYPDDTPLPVTLPDLTDVLGPGWEALDQGVMGEWYTYLILAHGIDPDAQLDTSDAEDAAEGWGGDAYAVYHLAEEDQTAMVLSYVWDTPADMEEFAQAFVDFTTLRFGPWITESPVFYAWDDPSGYTVFHIQDGATTWIFAPDETTATAIWQALQD